MEAAATELISVGSSTLPEFHPVDARTVAAPGAYVSLVGPNSSVRLGIIASTEDLQRIASIANQGEIDAEDLQDAACELANVLAGNVRKFLNARAPDLRLGLPMFSSKKPADDRFDVAGCELTLPDARATLLVMLPRRS